jgi:CRP-like cAMP-binding protein
VIRTASEGSLSGLDFELFPVRIEKPGMGFDPKEYLADAGAGKTVINLKREESVFSQGDPADTVLYSQNGHVTLTVISKNGKRATIAQRGVGNFIGEECLEPDRPTRMATATALIRTSGSMVIWH